MIGLALRLLAREWRAGELRVVLLAVALAVASLTAVRYFADRVEQALGKEANTLLAADLALVSDHPIDAAYARDAISRGLSISRTATFLSMALAGDNNLLTGIKAVEPGYPLRGALRVAPDMFADDAPTRGLPPPGEVWIDTRLASGLQVKPGDSVEVGASRLRIAAILTFEGERGGNFMALAPRLLMHADDLPRTGLIQPGSRVVYRLLVAGEAAEVSAFQDWAKPRLARGQQLEDVRDARPELRQILDRAQRYLGLASLLTVLLAAAATQLALRRYVQRQFDAFALLRCFGATQRRLFGLYSLQLGALGLLAGLLGSLLGWLAQTGMVYLLGDAIRLDLPQPGFLPPLLGIGAGLILVLAFSLPALMRLARVPALRVLRRDLGPTPVSAILAQGAAFMLVAGLLLWQAGEWRLASYVGVGVLGLMFTAAVATWLLLLPLPWLVRHLPVSIRTGLLSLRRRRWETLLQTMALSLGLLALLLLTLVRGDLFDSWRNKAPPDAPNRFLINIQPEQVEALRSYLTTQGIADVTLYPMARARLVKIDQRVTSPDDYPDSRAKRLIEREFNLSALNSLPPENQVVAGQWTPDSGFSVEQGLAETLGIRLGDELSFDAGGLPLSGTVTSLRSVEWDSFRVNFFVITAPAAFENLPQSFITSFYLPPGRGQVLAGLLAQHPNVTVIDVEQAMSTLRGVIDRVSMAVQLIFLFSLAVGVLVLVAALYAQRDERAREIGLWRTFGASRRRVVLMLASEFSVLGLIAGTLAAGAASSVAWLLADRVFELPHAHDPMIWLVGLGGGWLLVLGAGMLASRSLILAPPLQTLRRE